MTARRIAAAVLALPLLELVVAIAVGRWVGAGPTLLLILVGSVLGVLVLRREGNGALADLRAAQRSFGTGFGGGAATVTPDGLPVGEPSSVRGASAASPTRRPADRLLVVLAGVLLVVPGLVSDVAGLALLVPGARRLLGARAASVARRRGWTADRLAATGAGAGRIVSSDGVTVTDVRVTDLGTTLRTDQRTDRRDEAGHDEGPGPAVGPGPSLP